jgi:hypothetical protein
MAISNHIAAFFFMISNGKFMRIDLNELICCISMNDHAHLHTDINLIKSPLSLKQMKELLKEDKFIWINGRIALSRQYMASHP